MRIDKKIRDLPWAEDYVGGLQRYRILLHWPVIDGERLLVADFQKNQVFNASVGADKVRLVCSKKRHRAASIEVIGDKIKVVKDCDYMRAMNLISCVFYPEISPDDEKKLGIWLKKDPAKSGNHLMEELENWVKAATAEEAVERRTAAGEIADDEWELCPEELPEGLIHFIRQTVLPEDNTLIYKRGGMRGICYICGEKVLATTEKFRQHAFVKCPNCGTRVKCTLDGGAAWDADYVENVMSMQKGEDNETIFIREWHLLRDPTAKWENIESHLKEVARYAIRGSKAAKWEHEGKTNWCMSTERYWLRTWIRVKNVTYSHDGRYYFHVPENWRQIVKGTSLQYCSLDEYAVHRDCGKTNPLRFLIDWPRYPLIEKMWKAGYTRIVAERTCYPGKETQKALRWNKNSIKEGLRFPMRFLKLKSPEDWECKDLARMNQCWELAKEGTIREASVPEIFCSKLVIEDVKPALGHTSAEKIEQYLEHQDKYDYRDYLKQCVLLDLDLSQKAVLFPKDLTAAHLRTTKEMKYQADQKIEDLWNKRRQKLKTLEWESGDFTIRIPETMKDLTVEGDVLHHCVGGYVQDMALGKTTILFVRRKEDPDMPFFTLEWQHENVIQCRTKYNKSYTSVPAVHNFVQKWVDLQRKKGHKKEKIA